MKHRYYTAIVALLLLAVYAPVSAADDPDLDRIETAYLETVQSFYPVQATQMGVTDYDQRFADYSSRSVDRMVDELKDLDKRASRIDENRITADDRVSLRLLRAEIERLLVDLDKRKLHRQSPYLHVREVVDGLFYLTRRDHIPPTEQLFPILQRMRAVDNYLTTARKVLREPSPLSTEAALALLDDGMELYKKVGGELMNKLPERADEILKTSTRAREAMNDFAIWLTSAKPGEPGSFALGEDRFNDMLEKQFFLDFKSDSLLALSSVLLEQYQAEYEEFALFVEEQHQNGREEVFTPPSFGRDDLLAYYQWEVEQAHQETITREIVDLPTGLDSIVVVETPAQVRVLVDNTTYVPIPPFDESAQAMIWIRPLPEELSGRQLELRHKYVHRRGFRINAAVQAYPGRHTQAEWARAHKSDFRKWLQSSMLTDGWELYCEGMVNRPGYHGSADHTDPALWLAHLNEMRMRAALVTAEVRMHREQWSIDDAVEWMTQEMDIAAGSMRDLVSRRVTRSALFPGVNTAALVGKLEIELLGEALRGVEGDQFSLAAFHAQLLSQGAVPPTALWDHFGLNR